MTSALPVFTKPSPAAPSTGNSRAGSNESTPVRSRRVWVYSALESRRRTTGPGSPARDAAISSRTVSAHSSSNVRSADSGWGFSLGGISRFASCSATACQIFGCRFTSATDANRSRSRSPLCFSAE